MSIKDKLAASRKAMGVTQKQMADSMKISLTSYKKYESGESLPTVENLIKIADLLEISIDELCGRWNTSEDQELMIRIRKIEQLDNEAKKIVSTILESLLIRQTAKTILNDSV